MQGMTTDDKLLAQDDIDALLGEAGIEGDYEANESDTQKLPQVHVKKPSIRFANKSYEEVKNAMMLLPNKAFLEREDDVKVIWNASGTIPLATGLKMNIQDLEYISLGVLHDFHLVVKTNGNIE